MKTVYSKLKSNLKLKNECSFFKYNIFFTKKCGISRYYVNLSRELEKLKLNLK